MKVLNMKQQIVLFEFFGGIGCQREAFKRAGYEVVNYLIEREINSVIGYAVLHHNLNQQIHTLPDLTKYAYIQGIEKYNYTKNDKPVNLQKVNEFKLKQLYYATALSNNLGDFNNIKPEDIDYLLTQHEEAIKIATWSTPCQDFSVAGMMKGFDGNKGMLTPKTVDMFLKIKKKFDFLLFENVPAITNKRHIKQFETLIKKLNKRYKNKYFQLNAVDFDIPQNRKRIFMVSSQNKKFKFNIPKKRESTKKLSDLLEKDVDKKYFINKQQLNRYLYQGNVNPSGKGMSGRVNTKDVANTITTSCDQKVKIKENTKKGYKEATKGDGIRLNFCGSARGVVQKELAPTLLTGAGCSIGTPEKKNYKLNNFFAKGPLKIRRLRSLEAMRLTGFEDQSYYALKEANLSDSCIYNFCGNSIVVPVFLAIIQNLDLKNYKKRSID